MDEDSSRPTAAERLRRFVSGHRVPVVAGAVALAVVTGATGTGLYCYQRTESAQAAEARHLVTYANGGIGFQTCVGGGNVIITHYEPV